MTQTVADLLLLLATAIWGSTFPVVKDTISSIRPFTFLAVRFLTADCALLLYLGARHLFRLGSRQEPPPVSPSGLRQGSCTATLSGCVITGMVLLFAYCFQTFGMLTVPAGKAAFIVGMSVVIVPVVSAILFKIAPDTNTSIGVILAASGLGFMSLTLPFTVQRGDLLVFLGACGYAAHILLVGVHSKRNAPVVFSAVQVTTVCVGAFVAAILFERPLVIPRQAWGAILYCGIVASAFGIMIQSSVQRYTSPTHAAVIYTGEPVFGALFSWLILGETLSPREYTGAALILAGMLVSKLAPGKGQRKEQPDRERPDGEPPGEEQLVTVRPDI
ncbi:MAG: DMT family transporter [Firmicutes bacterium]|nr:DMT family transporter [Candidatus Fermentithermobacillaceae bacterium]